VSTTPARSTARDAETRPETGAGAALLSPVEGRLQRILADVDFPAISNDALEALKEVPDDESSIQRLANIVLREYALTVKVLRTANSAHYRRTDKHIRSAAHAMLLLGAGTVRHLAASLLLFEHYRKRSPGLKELMLLSLLTANHARELALLRGLPDPEEANLCGMFRNLGEVLVAAYFPRDYARILQAMEQRGCGQAAAAFEVLGFPYEALGEAMARNWGMPDRVVAGIRSAGTQASDDLLAITAFAHELTTAVYRRDADPARDGVTEVLARFAKRLKLGRDEVGGVLQSALKETRATFAAANVTLDGLTLRKQQHAALAALGSHESLAIDDESGDAAPGAGRETTADPLQLVRLELRGEVERMAMPGSGEVLSRVILTALEAAFRGGPFQRVVLCMMTTDHRQLKARNGLGAGVESLLDRFTCDVDSRTSPIALRGCVSRWSVTSPPPSGGSRRPSPRRATWWCRSLWRGRRSGACIAIAGPATTCRTRRPLPTCARCAKRCSAGSPRVTPMRTGRGFTPPSSSAMRCCACLRVKRWGRSQRRCRSNPTRWRSGGATSWPGPWPGCRSRGDALRARAGQSTTGGAGNDGSAAPRTRASRRSPRSRALRASSSRVRGAA